MTGTTISAGLFCGLTREAAARFSFLLSVPAVVLSGVYEAINPGKSKTPGVGLTGVALAYPQVPIIIPHFGAGLFREALMVGDLCPNVLFDTSSSNAWIRYQAELTLSSVFRQALAVVGPDRLLFGSDSSFFPRGWVRDVHEQQSAALDDLAASVEVREKVFAGNFDRLFPPLNHR